MDGVGKQFSMDELDQDYRGQDGPFHRSVAKAQAAAQHAFPNYNVDHGHEGYADEDDFVGYEEASRAQPGGGGGRSVGTNFAGGTARPAPSTSAFNQSSRPAYPPIGSISNMLSRATSSTSGGNASTSKRSSRVILVPPSPRLSNQPAPSFASMHDSSNLKVAPDTPPMIMLTPASNPTSSTNSPMPSPIPSASASERSVSPNHANDGPEPTQSMGGIRNEPSVEQQRRLSEARKDVIRAELANRRRSSSLATSTPAGGGTSGSPAPTASAQAATSPATDVGTATPRSRSRTNSRVKMSAGVMAMLRNSGGASKPTGAEAITSPTAEARRVGTNQDDTRPPQPAPVPPSSVVETSSKRPQPTSAAPPPTPQTGASKDRRESVSSVDSVPFGIGSSIIQLPPASQPPASSQPTPTTLATSSAHSFLPPVPTIPPTSAPIMASVSPSGSSAAVKAALSSSPPSSLKRVMISPPTTSSTNHDDKGASGGGRQAGSRAESLGGIGEAGKGKGRVILADFDDLTGLEVDQGPVGGHLSQAPQVASTSVGNTVTPKPTHDGKAKETSHPWEMHPDIEATTDDPARDARFHRELADLLRSMGLQPGPAANKELAAFLSAGGASWLSGNGSDIGEEGMEGEGSQSRRGPIVSYDRGGREFIIDEHSLSPVTERTELSSTLSTMRRGSGSSVFAQPQRPISSSTGRASPDKPSIRARLASILAQSAAASNRDATAHTDDALTASADEAVAKEERLKTFRQARRDRVAAATGMRPGSPQKAADSPMGTIRSISPFVHRKSIANSLASSIGDMEVLHSGPLYYQSSDPKTGRSVWRDYPAILTAETLYLALEPSGTDTLELTLRHCIALRPKHQPNATERSSSGPSVPGQASDGDEPRIRAFTMVWDDGTEETLGCKKVRHRSEWIQAIVDAGHAFGTNIETPQLPKARVTVPAVEGPETSNVQAPRRVTVQPPTQVLPSAARLITTNDAGDPTSDTVSNNSSTPTLRSELHKDLEASGVGLADSQHLYSEEAGDHLRSRLRDLAKESAHSIGSTHPSLSPEGQFKDDGDLFGMIHRLHPRRPTKDSSAFYDQVLQSDKPPPEYFSDEDPETTPRQNTMAFPPEKASSVVEKPVIIDATSEGPPGSVGPTGGLPGSAHGRGLQRDLFLAQHRPAPADVETAGDGNASIGHHMQKIHRQLGDITRRLQNGAVVDGEHAQHTQQPTVADKVDYMLSLCSILLESQHKVSTAVERTLKNRSSTHQRQRSQSTTAELESRPVSRAKRRARVSSSCVPDETIRECVPPPRAAGPVAEAAPSTQEAAPASVQDAALKRIEDLLGTIITRIDLQDQQRALAPNPSAASASPASKGKASTPSANRDFDPPTRPQTIAEGVRFSEPQDRFSMSASDVQSILDIEADVALWKLRERGNLPSVQRAPKPRTSIVPPFAGASRPQTPPAALDQAQHIAEERARAARRLEGHGSPRVNRVDSPPMRPPPPNAMSNAIPTPSLAPLNEQSKWSVTTPRKSESPAPEPVPPPVEKTSHLAPDTAASSPQVRISEEGPTFAPSTRPTSQFTGESSMRPSERPDAHGPVFNAMLESLQNQGEAAKVIHAHQAEMTRYLGQLNQFWEADFQKRNEDSRNLADGMSNMQTQMAVLAQRIADVFTPRPPETQPPPNNDTSDSLPLQDSHPPPARQVESPEPSVTLVDHDVSDPREFREYLDHKEQEDFHPRLQSRGRGMPGEPPSPMRQRNRLQYQGPKRSNSKARKMNFVKHIPDISAAFGQMGKLFGGPNPVADRQARWGVAAPGIGSSRQARSPGQGGLRRQRSDPRKASPDLNQVLTGLNLAGAVPGGGVQGLDVSEIMRLLREQKVEAVEQARHEAELRANDPELEADDLRSRQAYAEAFERQREAEIAREQAKGLEKLVVAYQDQLQVNQGALRKLVTEVDELRNAEREKGAADIQVKELEKRCEELRAEESEMTINVRQLYNMISAHGRGKLPPEIHQSQRSQHEEYYPPHPDNGGWTPGPYERGDRYWITENQPHPADVANHGYA